MFNSEDFNLRFLSNYMGSNVIKYGFQHNYAAT
jgi:hypothetical protein